MMRNDMPPNGQVDRTPLTAEERLELANRLYRQFYARCFWHCRPDLRITADHIPYVIKGLRKYGGRSGFMAAAALREAARSCR